MIKWIVSLLLILISASPSPAGRGDKSGTAAAPELLIPLGARAIAQGGASLSMVTGLESIYWNPAGLARMERRASAMFSHTSYLADIGVDYVAVGGEVSGFGSLALTLRSLSFGEIPVTTEDEPDGTGESTSPTFLTIGGTFSRHISDRISAGITSNVVYEKMANVSATTFAFNAGVQYDGIGGIDGLSVGVVIKNIGPSLKYDGEGLERDVEVNDALNSQSTLTIDAATSQLPSTIEVGLGYTSMLGARGQLRLSSVFQNNDFSEDEYKLGGEYVYDGKVFVRGGYSMASESEGQEYIYGLSGGVGIVSMISGVEVQINYAYRAARYFGGNHVIDVIIGI
ncbi:MAG TPA: PorV/PorQ family protein [Bacteroidota bacterium]|jgi:hypothetical protein|nr:PorV/PorQ family protein [Bacteroidota bacterium]